MAESVQPSSSEKPIEANEAESLSTPAPPTSAKPFSTTWLKPCRLFVQPYLPPPVVSSMHRLDGYVYENHGPPEASMLLLFSILSATIIFQLLQRLHHVATRTSALLDDDDDDIAAGATLSPSKDDDRELVVLCGASHAGKTCLFHALCSNEGIKHSGDNASKGGGMQLPQTVTSMKALEGSVHSPPSPTTNDADESNQSDASPFSARLLDYPGHIRLRHNLPPLVAQADRIVVTVDSTSTKSIREGADVLYMLLTNKKVVQQWESSASKRQRRRKRQNSTNSDKMEILMACTKADKSGAKNGARIKLLLRTELDRTRRTRASVAATANPVEDGEEQELPLGSAKKQLDLDTCADLPCQLQFVSVSCFPENKRDGKGGGVEGGLDAVREFVLYGLESSSGR